MQLPRAFDRKMELGCPEAKPIGGVVEPQFVEGPGYTLIGDDAGLEMRVLYEDRHCICRFNELARYSEMPRMPDKEEEADHVRLVDLAEKRATFIYAMMLAVSSAAQHMKPREAFQMITGGREI